MSAIIHLFKSYKYVYIYVYIIIGFSFLLLSCEKKNKEIFDTPPWLGGTNIETLEQNGDCEIFLQLMEKANYTEPITNQLFTLFVPRDSAFEAYFKTIGISTVDELSEGKARQLFTLHVLRNARSRYQLIYEYVWGEEQGPNGEYASFFFKKQTNSFPLPYQEKVGKYDPEYKDQTLLIDPRENNLPKNLYVPCFTSEFMEDYFAATDGSDYTFLYSKFNSQWSGTQWGNAMVTEAEVRTANGFIYYIDQVVHPLKSIEEYLRDNQDKYGIYYDLIQRFARYGISGQNEQGQQVFRKIYTDMYDIANHDGPPVGGLGPLVRTKYFTAYIPKNEVLETYLNENVYPYYSSVDSLPDITLEYIVQSPLTASLGLKSKIDKLFYNSFGDTIGLDSETDIFESYMCSNGAIYGMNRFLEPNVFSTVSGPLFFNKNYSIFLTATRQAGLINSISNPSIKVTLFAPTDEQLIDAGIRLNIEDRLMEFRGRDDNWYRFTQQELIKWVEGHIGKGEIPDLSDEGFFELNNGNYAYYNNNRIYGAGNFEDGDSTGFTTKEENKNGILYYLKDNDLKAPEYTAAERIAQDPDLSEFYNLMQDADLIQVNQDQNTNIDIPRITFLGESKKWTMFIPDNNAVAQAETEGVIPDPGDVNALADFIKNHFIKGDVIFDDGKKSGTFNTNMIDSVAPDGELIYGVLTISNSNHDLTITDQTGQEINIDHADANILVDGGVVHKIPAVIKHEE